MSSGKQNRTFGTLTAVLFLAAALLPAAVGAPEPAAGEEDPVAAMRATRFQVRVLCETAEKLKQKNLKTESIELLARACRTGWDALGGIPAERFGDAALGGPARSLAGEIETCAALLLGLLADAAPAAAEGAAPGRIEPEEIYRKQIALLDHVRGTAEKRLAWRLDRLDVGGTFEEMAVGFEESAAILDAMGGGAEEVTACRERLSAILDRVLEERMEELAALADGADISVIVTGLCRGRPGDAGKAKLKELLEKRFAKLDPRNLTRSRSGGRTEPAAPATAEQIVSFFNLACVVRRSLDPGTGGPIPGWRETFARYFRELQIAVRKISEESAEGNSLLTSRPGIDLSPYASGTVPAGKLRISLIAGESGQATLLPALADLGLDRYFLPPGSFGYLLEVEGEGGSLGTIFTAPDGVQAFKVTLPTYLPKGRIFIPKLGFNVEGWVFGAMPLTRGEFAEVIFNKKEEGTGRSRAVGGALKSLYTDVIGSEPVNGIRARQDLEAARAQMADRDGTVHLDAGQAGDLLQQFSSSLVKTERFTLAPVEQASLLSRLLLLTSAPGSRELTGDGVRILARELGERRPGEEIRFLLFPATKVVFSN